MDTFTASFRYLWRHVRIWNPVSRSVPLAIPASQSIKIRNLAPVRNCNSRFPPLFSDQISHITEKNSKSRIPPNLLGIFQLWNADQKLEITEQRNVSSFILHSWQISESHSFIRQREHLVGSMLWMILYQKIWSFVSSVVTAEWEVVNFA